MEHTYFPMFVDISDRKILVVGGGAIAARRVRTLLLFAAEITVAAPDICPAMQQLLQERRVSWIRGTYEKSMLAEKDFVLTATDNHEVNRQVVADCRCAQQKENRRILVNSADDKTLCDFYFPSVVQTGDVVIGINSSGRHPENVRKARKKIETLFGKKSQYGEE